MPRYRRSEIESIGKEALEKAVKYVNPALRGTAFFDPTSELLHIHIYKPGDQRRRYVRFCPQIVAVLSVAGLYQHLVDLCHEVNNNE